MIGLAKYFYKASVVMLFAGVLFGGFGLRSVVIFLDDIGTYREMTVWQYAFSILLPHISLLIGIAFFCFGLLLLVRGVLLNREHLPRKNCEGK